MALKKRVSPKAAAVAAETKAPKRVRKTPVKAAAPAAAAESEPVNGGKRGRAKDLLLYVDQYAPVWPALPEAEDTQVTLSSEIAPRGKTQIIVGEFMESQGRKKTTANMIIDHLNENEVPNSRGVVSHMINKGILEVAA